MGMESRRVLRVSQVVQQAGYPSERALNTGKLARLRASPLVRTRSFAGIKRTSVDDPGSPILDGNGLPSGAEGFGFEFWRGRYLFPPEIKLLDPAIAVFLRRVPLNSTCCGPGLALALPLRLTGKR